MGKRTNKLTFILYTLLFIIMSEINNYITYNYPKRK